MTHKKYCLVWDNGDSASGGIEYDTIEEAVFAMEDMYHEWTADAISHMDVVNGVCSPTPEQIEAWDTMIDTAWCTVVEWSDTLEEYEDVYYGTELSREQLFDIGWCPWYELNN